MSGIIARRNWMKNGAASAPLPADDDVPPAQRVKLLDLERGMCRWPIGEPGKPDFGFCGHETAEGRPYCPHHCDRAYVAPPPRKRAVASKASAYQ